MKTTLEEQLKKFKKLALMEATSASSSGSYEQPMSFESDVKESEEDFIGLTIADDAPQIDVVDITKKEDQNDINIDADIEDFELDLEGSDIDVDVHLSSPSEEEDEEDELLTLMNTLGLDL
tara:strand:+ start:5778 stop:6140 length:363 start_codon:yes stop_codon:yes gene_type:complete